VDGGVQAEGGGGQAGGVGRSSGVEDGGQAQEVRSLGRRPDAHAGQAGQVQGQGADGRHRVSPELVDA
jgi:hypothetical protein